MGKIIITIILVDIEIPVIQVIIYEFEKHVVFIQDVSPKETL